MEKSARTHLPLLKVGKAAGAEERVITANICVIREKVDKEIRER